MTGARSGRTAAGRPRPVLAARAGGGVSRGRGASRRIRRRATTASNQPPRNPWGWLLTAAHSGPLDDRSRNGPGNSAHYLLTGGPTENCFRRSKGIKVVSRPVRRILSRRLAAPEAAIPLGRRLPAGSSGLPGGLGRAGSPPPVWPCSGWGLPSRPGHPGRWCALTAPLHPYLCGAPGGASPSAVSFLWHCPAGRPDWVLPSTLPYGVRTFLGPVKPARGRPADSPPPAMLPAGRPWRGCPFCRRLGGGD